MNNYDLTQMELKRLLDYNRHTGEFTWKLSRGASKANTKAGSVDGCGYIGIKVNGNSYLAHRLVFLYIDGGFPPEQVDHINHNKADNRLLNLRKCTRSENQRNRLLNINNTSGVCGVVWDKKYNCWRANIGLNGKVKMIGRFKNKNDAIIARWSVEDEHGFHQNHGAEKCQ